ncbi:left-right determination factor 1-like [Amphiura filiformis]|uniref:left-right determination factor 1-like n=1 Tax=Amphiura filiformis TaxID=82378 RepID=UPI003B220549
MLSNWNLVLVFGFYISLDFIIANVAMDFDGILEKQLLSQLGINNPEVVPTLSKDDIVIPEDMRSLYTSMLRSHRTRRMIAKGIHKNPDIYGNILHTDPSRQSFSFDISSIPPHSEILMAELSLFKERPNESHRNHSHRHPVNSARATIHQIGKNASDMDHGERVAFKMYGNSSVDQVDERMVPVDSSGYTIFDVTTAVRHWLETPSSNQGLELRVSPFRPGRYANRVADSVRASMIRHGRHDLPGTEVDVPVLTIYTVKYAPREEPVDCEEGVEPTSCCRTPRYVDFHETQWANRWIIEPAGFEAYDCAGPCNRRNGHRRVRDIFSLPLNIPSGPSTLDQCAVARSSALPMMYLVENNGVTQLQVSEIPGMVIEECQCTR